MAPYKIELVLFSGRKLMVFGNSQVFAIEVMCEPELESPSQVWGRMQIWCDGVSIGDFSEEHCGLFGAYSGFKSLMKTLPKQWMNEFEKLSDLEIWNRLDAVLYGIQDIRTVEECRNDWDKYGHFNFLTNWGEQFDRNGKSFILCRPDGNVKILNRSIPVNHGISLNAPLFNVETAIQDFVKWFEDETLRSNG
jgi:hypothetical protein